jgi:hypothetical protein
LLQQRGYVLENITKHHLGYHAEYEKIRKELTLDGFDLKPEFKYIDSSNSLKGTKLLIANPNDISQDRQKQFINLFYSKENNSQIFFGKIQEFDNNFIIFKHFNFIHDDNNRTISLTKCLGCRLDTNKDSRSNYCKIKQFYFNAFRIDLTTKYVDITLDGCVIHEIQISEIYEILK